MKRIARALPFLLGIALLAGLVALAVWAVRAFFGYLSAVPKELGAALVAGAATVLVATLTVMLGRYFERKKELDALYREKKTEIYDAFLKQFFDLTASDTEPDSDKPNPDLVAFLREFTRTLILWSGPGVINAFLAWKEHLAKGVPDAQTMFRTEDLLIAIRQDLRHSNAGLKRGFFARIYLRESSLFMAAAAKNPNITLAELAALEQVFRESADSG
jgi:hypothetical protein